MRPTPMPMQATQRAGSAFWSLRPLALQCCTGLTRSQQVPGWPRVCRQLCAGDQTAPMVPVPRPCHYMNVLSCPTETLRPITPWLAVAAGANAAHLRRPAQGRRASQPRCRCQRGTRHRNGTVGGGRKILPFGARDERCVCVNEGWGCWCGSGWIGLSVQPRCRSWAKDMQ